MILPLVVPLPRGDSKQKLGSKDWPSERRARAGSKAAGGGAGLQPSAVASSAGEGPGLRAMTPVASCVGAGEAPLSPPLRASVWWIDDSDARLGKSSCLSFSQLEQEKDVQDMPSLPPIASAAAARPPPDADQGAEGAAAWPPPEERGLLGAGAPDNYRPVDDVTAAELQVLLERPGRGKYAASGPPARAPEAGPSSGSIALRSGSSSRLLSAVPEDTEQVRPPPALGGTAPLPRAARGRPAPRGAGADRAASGRMPRRVPSLAEEEDDGAAARGVRPARSSPVAAQKGRSKRREPPAAGIAISSRESDMRRRWMLEDPSYMSRRISELRDANFRAKSSASSVPKEDAAAGPTALLATGPAGGGAASPQAARRRGQHAAPLPPAAAPPVVAAQPVPLAGQAAAKRCGDHVAEVRQLTLTIASSSRLLKLAQQAEESEAPRNTIAKTFGSMFRRSNRALDMLDRASAGDAVRSAPLLLG